MNSDEATGHYKSNQHQLSAYGIALLAGSIVLIILKLM
jgi:hypothetical protein